MKYSLTVTLATRQDSGRMSEWIEQLKRQESEREQDRAVSDRIKLRQDQILSAKAPDFWNAFTECAKAECINVKTALPNTPDCHCDVEEEPTMQAVTITGQGIKNYSVRLVIDFRSSQLRETRTVMDHDTMQRRVLKRLFHSFGLDQNENVAVLFLGERPVKSPEDLAERYVKMVVEGRNFS